MTSRAFVDMAFIIIIIITGNLGVEPRSLML